MSLYKLAALITLTACTEPVVDVILSGDKPNNLDTTCATAIGLKVFGADYESDPGDVTWACHEIAGNVPTVIEVKKQFAGLFEVDIPRSGLGGAQLEAFSGICPTTIPPKNPRANDLVFMASARYDGEGSLVLPIEPVASCLSESISTRVIDVFKLTATKDCTLSLFEDATQAELTYGQIAPTLFDGPSLWTPRPYNKLATGIGSAAGLRHIGPYGCMIADVGTDAAYSTSCVDTSPDRKMVCATGAELEVGVAPMDSLLASLDPLKVQRWGGFVIGSVWTGIGTARTPLAGVTVEADPAHSEVIFVEPLANNTLRILTGTATSDKGMFVLFTDTVLDVTLKAGNSVRTVKMGALHVEEDPYPAVALVQM